MYYTYPVAAAAAADVAGLVTSLQDKLIFWSPIKEGAFECKDYTRTIFIKKKTIRKK